MALTQIISIHMIVFLLFTSFGNAFRIPSCGTLGSNEVIRTCTKQTKITSLSLFQKQGEDVQVEYSKAAVIVPGFLTGANDFKDLANQLTKKGIPTVVVPMPVWHWIPCIGGRSMRPILERIDYTVQHLCAYLASIEDSNMTISTSEQMTIPPLKYSILDCIQDFLDNPGGALKVGGSDEVDEYPLAIKPRGDFVLPSNSKMTTSPKKIALIGHSAGGWISRVYLSDRSYGGKIYAGTEFVHSLVTLGTPHSNAPGPAFKSIQWINREPLPSSVKGLAIGAIGTPGHSSGDLTKNAYAFCVGNENFDGSAFDGDGLSTTETSTSLEGEQVEIRILPNVTHFPWSDTVWGDLFAPELSSQHRDGLKPWYGDEHVVDQWIDFLL